jgi:hypothetical protein
MALETAQYINQLNQLNPAGADLVSTADDHIRLIKSTLKNSFPMVSGPVTISNDALNSLEFLVDIGTADTYVVNPILPWAAYASGKSFTFRANNSSLTKSPTINVSSLGAVLLKDCNGNPAIIKANGIYNLSYYGTYFIVKNSTCDFITDTINYTPSTSTKVMIRSTDGLSLSAGSVERLTIDSTGKFGLNTTTPAYDLDIVGQDIRLQSNTANCFLHIGPQTSPGVFYGRGSTMGFYSTSSNCEVTVSKDATDPYVNIISGNGLTSKINFVVNGAVRSVIDERGRLQIGYTTGLATVNISSKDDPSAGLATFIELKNTSTGATNIKKYVRMDATGSLEIRNSTNDTTLFKISDAGIITTVPGAISSASLGSSTSTAVTQPINDKSTKIATTEFCNRDSNTSIVDSNYCWFMLPNGAIMLWGTHALGGLQSWSIDVSTINAAWVGKTVVNVTASHKGPEILAYSALKVDYINSTLTLRNTYNAVTTACFQALIV